ARAATRLADAKIESLRAATDKKNTVKKPFNHDEFMAQLRPAIRDIYGLEIPDGFEKDFPITSDCDLTAHSTSRRAPTTLASSRQNPTNVTTPARRLAGDHRKHPPQTRRLANHSNATVASGTPANTPTTQPFSQFPMKNCQFPPAQEKCEGRLPSEDGPRRAVWSNMNEGRAVMTTDPAPASGT
ncbi:MAG: hypothetical protein AABZ08_12210, partial [Planctomycetota bacterium]